MITVLIAEDRDKVSKILEQLLLEQGNVLIKVLRQEGIFTVTKKKLDLAYSPLKDLILELEDSLYNQNERSLYNSFIEAIERPLFERVLERAEGNQLKAAGILGINRNTMRAKIKKLGISPARYRQ